MTKKGRLSPFAKSQIKQNIPYLLISLVLIVLTIVTPLITLPILLQNKASFESLQDEVADIKQKTTIANQLTIKGSTDIQENIAILNSLIPPVEDYFSIFTSLDQLAAQSGLIISSFTIPTTSSNSDVLTIEVEGIGDESTFINLIQNHNFVSERFVTIDGVELNQTEGALTIKLSLSFYHKQFGDVGTDKAVDYQKIFNLMNEIKNKMQFAPSRTAQTTPQNPTYPVKVNPF